MIRRSLFLLLATAVAAILVPGEVAAQTGTAPAATFDLSIENIMRGPELVGRPPSEVRWTPDGRWIHFQWNEPGTDWREPLRPYRVRAVPGAKPERISLAHRDSMMPLLLAGSESRDRRWRAVEHRGDLYLVDRRAGTSRRLTRTPATESDPQLDATGERLFFLRDDNVFALELGTGLLSQVTDIRKGPAAKEADPDSQRVVLEGRQGELFRAIRDRVRADSLSRAERDSVTVRPDSLFLGNGERIVALSVSPSAGTLLLTTASGDTARRTEVPEFVTESGYTEALRVRGKVGDRQSTGRVALVTVATGASRWLEVVPGDSAAAPATVRVLGWDPEGGRALLHAVTPDYETRYLRALDASTGRLSTLDVLPDSAWVGGPCFECAGWYPEGGRVWYVSEADGFAQMYAVDADGTDRRRLTEGRWEVLQVEAAPDGRHFLLHANAATPYERHLYRLPMQGGELVQLTRRPGAHDGVWSPDGRWIADVHSVANRPPELFLMANRPGAEMSQLTTSPTAEWLAFPWQTPEIVEIPASDGVRVPARIYRPTDLGAQPNGAAVIFVHGAGYLQNVHNFWSSYFREYMFHHLLASRGYVVLDIDYRGSAGHGRDWRTAIDRFMGGRDLQDQVDGSRYLQRELGIDPERVGIYGGSYGGFITLMALFTEPEWFGAGAALRSVTDWSHYNHGYTARILNLPQRDTLAYRRSSPISFAEGLRDPLLIAHGMVDVNVHFQDVVRLTQRLIELGKEDWEMAVYPVEDHAFVRPSSWTDEYRRILELFERTLPTRVPIQPDPEPRPVPGGR